MGGAPPATVQLVQGWNGVCYSGQTKGAEAATAGIDGQFTILYDLEPDQHWKRFVPGRPDISDLGELRRFAALLLLVTESGGAQWAFDP